MFKIIELVELLFLHKQFIYFLLIYNMLSIF